MTSFDLENSEIIRIFNEDLLERFVASEGTRPLPETPEFIILGGQPGAGKTGELNASTRAANEKSATWTINADDFAVYHPYYEQMQTRYGAKAADMVRSITAEWVKRTITAAQERRVNVVFESTMRQPGVVKHTVAEFRERGYIIHAKIIAVSPMVSWQGNHSRREALAMTGAPSRLATREAHDAAVKGSHETAAMLEREHLVDRITLVNRNGHVLYDNAFHNGAWKIPLHAAECLQRYRSIPLSAHQARRHDEAWEKILEMAEYRHLREGVARDIAQKELDDIRKDRANDAAMASLQ